MAMDKYPKDPLKLYDMAWKLAKQDPEIMDEYKWLVNVAQKTNLSRITKDDFLERYAWVVYTSGFRESIIDEKWDNLKNAFQDFLPDKIDNNCIKNVRYYFDHEGKAKAVITTAYLLQKNNWKTF